MSAYAQDPRNPVSKTSEKVIWWKTSGIYGYRAEPVEVVKLTSSSIRYWDRDWQGNRTHETTARFKSEWTSFFATAKEAADFLASRFARETESYLEHKKDFEKIHRELLATTSGATQ
jgi:hypothetical protein